MLSTRGSVSRPVVGLALGAGGIRGAAHAGVLLVLQEAGIPIDLVVGASAGALYGLSYASGVPAAELARAARSVSPLDLIRFYSGRLRASRFNPIGRMLLEAGTGKDLADLEHPFAVMVTDVLRGETVALRSGPVVPAVQASIALPFIARPVEIGGRLYADGGMLDTLPVRTAREMGADLVIGVCLGYNYIAPRAFRRRPWTRDVLHRIGRQSRPSLMPAVNQVRYFARLCAATFEPPPPSSEADVTIWPELDPVGPNSFRGSAFCFDQGVAAARAALPQIERLLARADNTGQV